MESTSWTSSTSRTELAALFSDLVRLETELWDHIDHRLREDHDVPLSWFEPLQVMDRVPNCRVADIARALSLTVGGTSKLVDRIERAGWCTREPNPDDARSSLLNLTHTGRHRLESARISFEDEIETCIGAALTPRRLASLASAIRTVRRHVADQQEGHR